MDKIFSIKNFPKNVYFINWNFNVKGEETLENLKKCLESTFSKIESLIFYTLFPIK